LDNVSPDRVRLCLVVRINGRSQATKRVTTPHFGAEETPLGDCAWEEREENGDPVGSDIDNTVKDEYLRLCRRLLPAITLSRRLQVARSGSLIELFAGFASASGVA
jgi:hypothetical protein